MLKRKIKQKKSEQAMLCVNEENVSPEEEKTGGVPIIGCRGYWHSVLVVRLSYMRSPSSDFHEECFQFFRCPGTTHLVTFVLRTGSMDHPPKSSSPISIFFQSWVK